MTSVQASPFRVDLSQVKKMDVSGLLKPVELSDEQKAKFRAIEEMKYTRPVNLQDHGSQKVYATVEVNGKTVATLYNSGAVMTSNADYGRVSKIASVSAPQGTGPNLAQERAEDIAKALGGTVVPGKDALTQAEFYALPPIEFKVDYAAMEADRAAAKARQDSAATLVQAQMLAQQDDRADMPAATAGTIDSAKGDNASGESVVDKFLKFAEMTPAEKMRAMVLHDIGMTEEELNSLPPEARAEIEEKIREKIKEMMKEKSGLT